MHGHRRGCSGVGSFIVGGIVGAVLGLLFAPHSGVETRQMIVDRASDYWGEAGDLYAVGLGKVEDAVETGKHAAVEKSEELRTVIDEARVRLQEQVAKSAEVAKDRIAENTPVVKDVVDKAAGAAKEGVETVSEKAQETLEAVAKAAHSAGADTPESTPKA
ncbi:MAG: YtxH domain-containing protein [Coriobacteriia bacterium]|nr:YtxH domain-containing protein [Coriobacteriia bacterium]